MRSEFSEKEFENIINQELKCHSSNQVAEKILGYDAIANPGAKHKIWSYLCIGNKPTGLKLTPKNWGAITKPSTAQLGLANGYVTSLIIQYKRSDYLSKSTSTQFKHWNGPYYRFAIKSNQQLVLENLETNLAGKAVVTYAAPCFHTYSQFFNLINNKSVLSSTGFVFPKKLSGHKYWTFQKPGNKGIANRFIPEENIKLLNYADIEKALIESSSNTIEELLITNSTALIEAVYIKYNPSNDEGMRKDFDRYFNRIATENLPNFRKGTNQDIINYKKCLVASDLLGLDWKICFMPKIRPIHRNVFIRN